jgi:hypothetical protein
LLAIVRQRVRTGRDVTRGSEVAGKDDAERAANDGHLHGFTWPLVLVAGVVLTGFSVYELFDRFLFGLGNTELSNANVAAGSSALKCGLSAVAMFPVLLIFVRLTRGRQHHMRLAWAGAIILTQIALVTAMTIEARASVPQCFTLVCENPGLL